MGLNSSRWGLGVQGEHCIVLKTYEPSSQYVFCLNLNHRLVLLSINHGNKVYQMGFSHRMHNFLISRRAANQSQRESGPWEALWPNVLSGTVAGVTALIGSRGRPT